LSICSRKRGIIVFLSVLIIFSSISLVSAQDKPGNSFLKFSQIADSLSQKHKISFFYKPEWFEMRYFNPAILDLSLNDALDRIKTETDYSVYTIDSTLYIFVPVKPEQTRIAEVRADVITIGNPDEYGKFTRAAIHGKVRDGGSKKSLPGTSIFIDRLRIGVTADNNGNYQLRAPVGEHIIRLSFLGYDENTYKIFLTGDGNLDLEIFEKSIKLDEVIISAERSDRNISGSQMSYVRLDAQSIKELPVSFGVTDIIKSITLLPGIQTIGEFGTGFNVRGGSADQNLILLEDVPIFNPSHVFGLTSVINPEGISTVTLSKGGIPAKYGERASSVLDIRFGSGNPGKTVVSGGLGLLDSRLYLETPLSKKVSFLVSGRSSYSDWLLQKIPDIELMNSSARFWDTDAFLTYEPSASDRISLFAYLSSDHFGFSKSTIHQYENLLASAKWKHSFNSDFNFQLTAGLSNYTYNLNEADILKEWESYNLQSSVDYKNIKWNFSWHPGAHSAEFGLNSIFYRISPGEITPSGFLSDVSPRSVQGEKAGEYALYVSDNFSVSPKILVDAGLRFSGYTYLGPNKVYSFRPDSPLDPGFITDSTYYGNNGIICLYGGIEPRLSARYLFTGSSSLKVSYNRIHQYINLVSNTSVMTPSDVWKLSSPNLKPLVCDHLALGYFQNYKNNSVETSVEIYYKRLTNAIDYKNGAKILLNPYLETDLLNARGRNYGIELYVKKSTGRLTGWASYTWSRSFLRTSGIFEEEKINNNNPFPSNFDRPHNLALNFNYHITKRWRLGGTFTFNSGRPCTLPEYKFDYRDYQLLWYSDRNKYRLPVYHRLDVFITYDKSIRIRKKFKGSWTLSVLNLYGRENAYSVFYKKEEHMVSYEYRMYDNYMLYIIGMPFPTLTYNFTFTK
jgi:hypothetical protein